MWAAGLQGTVGHNESQPQATFKQFFTERVIIAKPALLGYWREVCWEVGRKERESGIQALWIQI